MTKKKILVVDDEFDIIETLSVLLKSRGYSVITASNSQDGLTKAKDESPNLIVLDLMMPNIDGFEVCRKLKSDYATMRIPVIILTARSDEKARKKALEVKADDYMVKPFSMPALVDGINRLLYK